MYQGHALPHVTNATQSASALHAELIAESQPIAMSTPLRQLLHAVSAAFGVAAHSVAPHCVLQFDDLQ